MSWWKGYNQLPCCMNEADVRILPLRRDGEVSEEPVDEDFQEPTGPYKREDSELVLKAQVVFNKYEQNMTLFNGDTVPVKGHLTFKTQKLNTQLKKAGLVGLHNGDMITGLSTDLNGTMQAVEFLIVEVRPTAWLRGVPITTTAFFTQNTEKIAGSFRVK